MSSGHNIGIITAGTACDDTLLDQELLVHELIRQGQMDESPVL